MLLEYRSLSLGHHVGEKKLRLDQSVNSFDLELAAFSGPESPHILQPGFETT